MIIIYVLWFILVNTFFQTLDKRRRLDLVKDKSNFNRSVWEKGYSYYDITSITINIVGLLGILLIINLIPIKIEYSEKVTLARNNYKTSPDDNLKKAWMDAMIKENKYFIYMFMIVVYLPVFFIVPNYEIPLKTALLTLLSTTIFCLIMYEIIHGVTADVVLLICFLIFSPLFIMWTINCFTPGASLFTLAPLLVLFITIIGLIIYEMIHGPTEGMIWLIIALIAVPLPVIWGINCIVGSLGYTKTIPLILWVLILISLILYTVYHGATTSIIMIIIALMLSPLIVWLINCYHLNWMFISAALFDILILTLLIMYEVKHGATPGFISLIITLFLIFFVILYQIKVQPTP